MFKHKISMVAVAGLILALVGSSQAAMFHTTLIDPDGSGNDLQDDGTIFSTFKYPAGGSETSCTRTFE